MNVLNRLILLITAMVTIFTIVSCSDDPNGSQLGNNGETRLLVLNLGNSTYHNTLLPDYDMDTASYDIKGTGPNGAIFNISTSDKMVQVADLAIGEWTVHINAKNNDTDIIGQGSQGFTLEQNKTAYISMPVTPLVGPGTLDLSLSWNGADTNAPIIEAKLVPAEGAEIPLNFTISGGNSGTFTSDSVPAGYYTLSLQLKDSDVVTAGTMEVVRIVKDQTTTGNFAFTNINKATGNIDVNIDSQMGEPLDVNIADIVDTLKVGATMTVTASVSEDVGNIICIWYVNGQSKATGTSYTFGDDLAAGSYTLSASVYTVDGKQAGSISQNFTVAERIFLEESMKMYDNDGNITNIFKTFFKDDYTVEKGIQYSGPGTDGEWNTDDDEIATIIKTEIGSDSIERDIFYSSAGEDNIWNTSDDAMQGYGLKETTDNGKIYQTKQFNAGPDNVWFTSDDELISSSKVVKDNTGKTIQEYMTHSWFGENSTSASRYEYDALNNVAYATNSGGIGADKIWFTDDDLFSGHGKRVYSDNFQNLLQTFDYTDNGADGIPYTDDDTLMYYESNEYDEFGNKTLSKVCMNPGTDGTWFTEDDLVSNIGFTYIEVQ